MKRTAAVRALWSAAALLAVADCAYILHHFERHIALTQTSIESLYAMTSANERTIHDAAHLRAQRDAARRDLAKFDAAATLPSATAAVLEALERQARAHHASVTAVAPAAQPLPSNMRGLLPTPLTLRVRGRFRDLLGFLSDVAQRTPLVEIRHTELAPAQKPGAQAEPVLDAAIDATMYRLVSSDLEGEMHAAHR